MLIIEYIGRKRFSFRLSVTFGNPLSRKLLNNLLPKGKISNATIWANIEAMKFPSACRSNWLLPVSRTAKNSPQVRDTHGSYLLRIMVLLTKARFWDWSMVINNLRQYQGLKWKDELMLQRLSKWKENCWSLKTVGREIIRVKKKNKQIKMNNLLHNISMKPNFLCHGSRSDKIELYAPTRSLRALKRHHHSTLHLVKSTELCWAYSSSNPFRNWIWAGHLRNSERLQKRVRPR